MYKYTVLQNKVYLGNAEGDSKKWFYNHRKSFNNKISANDITLSKYLWELRETLSLNILVNCQKGTTLLKYIQEVSAVPYPRPDELFNRISELISSVTIFYGATVKERIGCNPLIAKQHWTKLYVEIMFIIT